MYRVLTVTQARSLYLKRMAEARQTSNSAERRVAEREVKHAVKALQQAQMTARLRQKRGRIARPMDWNAEVS